MYERTTPLRTALALLALVAIMVLSACTTEEGSGGVDAATGNATTSGDSGSGDSGSSDSGDSSADNSNFGILLVIVGVAVVGLIAWTASRSGAKKGATAEREASAAQQQAAEAQAYEAEHVDTGMEPPPAPETLPAEDGDDAGPSGV